jgi:hypothetical protein
VIRRARRAPIAAVLAAAALVAVAAVPSGAAAGRRLAHDPQQRVAPAASGAKGLAVVQYAATNPPPLPWGAHLVSGSGPATLTASGPRAAPDADGGTQVVYRNPAGDVIWLDGATVGHFVAVDVSAATGIAPLLSEPVAAVSPHGLDEVFCVTRSGHLLLLTWDPYRRRPPGGGGPVDRDELWTRTDLTQLGGPRVVGTPSVVVAGGATDVFTRTASGDLVEYANDGLYGHRWNGYDLSEIAAGPALASDPAAFYDPLTEQVRVAGTELAPHRGDVVVFTPNDVGGRVWSVQDVTQATGTPPVSAGLTAVIWNGQPTLFGAGPTGDLTEYEGVDTTTGTTWTVTDLTAATAGAPEIAGTPSASVSGARVAVAGVAAAWGDLFAWSTTSPTGPFTVTDVSITGSGPRRTAAGTPAAVFVAGQLSIFAASVAVLAPEGTGVYSIPFAKWPQALKDGWPILGVTGGLGSQCPPWTALSTPVGAVGPDEGVGQVIQASHVRATWLSFWTVSGPGTQPSSACTKEKGPITARTFYLHGYLAGAYVASVIDSYRSDGLALKPDWVLFDPEGYPDNNSGLIGPTHPASALSKSVANWYAILNGWHNGLHAVDPTLKAGLYANQAEYMTYALYGQPLPTFVAGAFQINSKGQLQVPTRFAFGPNILGFVMFNDGSPTCAQVANEALLLTEPPWEGDYNTVQITPGKYCPPGTG